MKKLSKINIYKGHFIDFDFAVNCYFVKTKKEFIKATSIKKLKELINQKTKGK